MISTTERDTLRGFHVLGVINDRQLQVLELRHVHHMSLRTTALALGLAKTTVADLEKRGLQKINLHLKGAA